jgi:hypothetical protein
MRRGTTPWQWCILRTRATALLAAPRTHLGVRDMPEPTATSRIDAAGPGGPFAADRTLELPMRLLGRTVKRTADALGAMQPGQVLALVTDDP